MEILEFGNKKNKKIILIHGFESPYQTWNEYINYYKKIYHIIVPILPGHNPRKHEEFISLKKIAQEIEEYYISRYKNKVYTIYGMSMGGVLASLIWQNRKIDIENLILESSPLVSYNKIMTNLLTKQYISLTNKTKQRDSKTISRALKSFVSKNNLKDFINLIDNISEKTIINYIKEIGNYKLPKNINTPNTKVYYFHGTKINEFYAKKTAKYILKNYPNSTIKVFKRKGHCEDSTINPKVMINELDNIIDI